MQRSRAGNIDFYTATKAFFRQSLVPGAAFFGAGLVAIGIWLSESSVTFAGAMIVAIATAISQVSQVFFREKIEKQNQLLLEQANTIASQALRIESLVTGGKGFAHLAFHPRNASTSDSFVVHAVNGVAQPIYEINARIVDATALAAANPDPHSPLFRGTIISLGTMPPNSAKTLQPIMVRPGLTAQDFNIFWNGRNGFWMQLVCLRKTNGRWFVATKVYWGLAGPDPEVMYESVHPGYPTNADGSIEWN